MTRTQPAFPNVAPLASHRSQAETEAWICKRLALRDLFAGVTDQATRAARLKVTLLERGLLESIAGQRNKKPVTWRQLYEQLYGEEIAD